MAEKNNATLGFEKEIWDAACVLWGHIPAADYRKVIVIVLIIISSFISSEKVYATTENTSYYLGETQEKKDAGYEENKEMKQSDSHYGWNLGQFCISGYTRQTTGENGAPLFLKNVGDTVELTFQIEQDIEQLNGDDAIFISNDTNGYDDYFGISKNERTDFGQGTLLVKYTDYQNKTSYIEPYTNYLKGIKKGATTQVQFFEEGDYEIALDYEIRKNNINFWKINTAPTYTYYQILIQFSIRNGNCMVYPFDVETGAELINTAFTENGFYLDLAKSRYLTIDVIKQNYVESEGALVEDTRFNKPAADGEKFTDEGVYIITVKNLYTGSETEKSIYVGSEPILKAYVTTGKDIEYIKEMLNEGAIIEDDGTITLASKKIIESETEIKEDDEIVEANNFIEQDLDKQNIANYKYDYKIIIFITTALFLIILILNVGMKRRKKKNVKKEQMDIIGENK